MEFEYTDDQEILRNEIVRFARNELNRDTVERDYSETFSRELWLKCGEMGLQGLPVDEEFGGAGLDSLTTAIAVEAFGYGCRDGGLVFSVCAHLFACVVPIWRYGSDDQKKTYLPGLCNGTIIAVNAMTESTSGSDAFHMATRAVHDGDGYRISGTKVMCSNGPVADLAVVYALTDPEKGALGGVSGYLVPTTAPGVTTNQKFSKMGLRTSTLGEVVFDDVFVPKEAMLGGEGGGTTIFSYSMEWERVCIGASHVGTMQHLLDISIDYARTRSAGGQPIGKYQAISHKIADMKIRLETARLLVYQSAYRLGNRHSSALDASMTKTYVSECLVQSALDTTQIFGGYGFLTETEVERVLRDSIGSTIYSGTNEVQRNIIAGWLGL